MDSVTSHHIIFRKQNYRNIELTRNQPGVTVGVLKLDGDLHYMRWLGVISRTDAKLQQGKPVKLAVSRVDGYDLKPGEYLVGCVLDNGVYAVLDTTPAFVKSADE